MYKKLLLVAFMLTLVLTGMIGCERLSPPDLSVPLSTPDESSEGSQDTPVQAPERQVVYAPDFTLMDLEGNEVTLATFGGQNIILNFWATWCPFCVDEMPDLQKIHEKYQEDNLIVLAVNVQESKDRVLRFLEDEDLDLPILLDTNGRTAAAYGANAIPLTVAINQEGEVVTGFRGKLTYEQMELMVEMIFNSLQD